MLHHIQNGMTESKLYLWSKLMFYTIIENYPGIKQMQNLG